MSSTSLESLYKKHHGWLHGWLRSRLGCTHSAADLAHDTYMRMLVTGNLPAVDDSRRYLVRIAKGLMIDLYRRRRIEAAYLDTLSGLSEPEVPDVETRQMIIESLVEIDAMLDSLPARMRQALLLRQLDGLSYKDIARQLGVSVSSVEKYVAQGLAACYRALAGMDP